MIQWTIFDVVCGKFTFSKKLCRVISPQLKMHYGLVEAKAYVGRLDCTKVNTFSHGRLLAPMVTSVILTEIYFSDSTML